MVLIKRYYLIDNFLRGITPPLALSNQIRVAAPLLNEVDNIKHRD